MVQIKKVNDTSVRLNIKVLEQMGNILNSDKLSDAKKVEKLSQSLAKIADVMNDPVQKKTRPLTEYQTFMKKHFDSVKQKLESAANGQVNTKEILAEIARMWRESKGK